MPNIPHSEIEQDISSKTREFFEFVLPPVDMFLYQDRFVLLVDMPGFNKDEIQVYFDEQFLTIHATKGSTPSSTGIPVVNHNVHNYISDADDSSMLYGQRPRRIDKKIKLPYSLIRGTNSHKEPYGAPMALYDNGVLKVDIPINYPLPPLQRDG